MKKPNRLSRVAVLVIAAALAAGCSIPVRTSPDGFAFPSAEAPALAASAPVEVTNGFPGPEGVSIEGQFDCDLQQFTDTAVQILARELAKKGVATAPGAERKVVLRVLAPVWGQGFGFMRGLVSLQAELGGKVINVEGEARSMGDATRTYNAAIGRAVLELMKRPEFRDYLAAR